MSDDAQERKDRADKLRQRFRRPEPGSSGPAPEDEEPPEGESLKEGVERRMRELDEADGEEHPPPPDDDR
ncbi:hypothetical protein ADK52_36545 [Streptomyces sp. WM6372]|uniref:hypothetical protein n=1 Tax=Streptomyces sp. WM6372 TaxID=1415555 RepID=UPI0006AFEFE0|nr:hypothetical protein [Streptomyces sp. WM6372]KOU14861.1 hypothetical protein ADK52_36545 [Streptomyces sp. WM6372]